LTVRRRRVRAGWISIHPMPRPAADHPLTPAPPLVLARGGSGFFPPSRGAPHLSAHSAATH